MPINLVPDDSLVTPPAGNGPELLLYMRQSANQGDVANTTSGFFRYSDNVADGYFDPETIYDPASGSPRFNLPAGKYFITGTSKVVTSGSLTRFQLIKAGTGGDDFDRFVFQGELGASSTGINTHTYGFIYETTLDIQFTANYSNDGAGFQRSVANVQNFIKIYRY